MTGESPPIRTLVVEDEPEVAAVHGHRVSQMNGFRLVGLSATGADAIADVERLQPDLVLLDLFLPDMPGLDVLRHVRNLEWGDRVGVIAITAAREVDSVRAAMAGGVVHYLVKPFSPDLFHARLLDFAERHGRLNNANGAIMSTQGEIDRVLQVGAATGRRRLPKGLSHRSMHKVLEALREHDLTAAEAGDHCGMSRVTARRYLSHLEHTGVVVAEPQYGGRGRPTLLYRLVNESGMMHPN